MTRLRAATPITLALLVLVPLATAMASSDTRRDERQNEVQRPVTSAAIDASRAIAVVQAAGYTAIRSLEWEHGGWTVKANNTEGRRVELRADATTGTVTTRQR